MSCLSPREHKLRHSEQACQRLEEERNHLCDQRFSLEPHHFQALTEAKEAVERQLAEAQATILEKDKVSVFAFSSVHQFKSLAEKVKCDKCFSIELQNFQALT